jgi:hypothetical protein
VRPLPHVAGRIGGDGDCSAGELVGSEVLGARNAKGAPKRAQTMGLL